MRARSVPRGGARAPPRGHPGGLRSRSGAPRRREAGAGSTRAAPPGRLLHARLAENAGALARAHPGDGQPAVGDELGAGRAGRPEPADQARAGARARAPRRAHGAERFRHLGVDAPAAHRGPRRATWDIGCTLQESGRAARARERRGGALRGAAGRALSRRRAQALRRLGRRGAVHVPLQPRPARARARRRVACAGRPRRVAARGLDGAPRRRARARHPPTPRHPPPRGGVRARVALGSEARLRRGDGAHARPARLGERSR